MAGNQREIERKTKKRNKELKTQRIVWSAIILTVIVLAVMKFVEIDFNSVKDKFIDDSGNLNVNSEIEVSAYPYELDSSDGVKVNYQSDRLNVLTDTSCTVLNPKDAKPLYTFSHGYSNPIVRTAGNYFCLIDQGADRLRLDSLQENVYESKTENPILCADVSKSGTMVYATVSKENKCTLYVVNKSLKTVLEQEINSGYVVAVAIDATGKKCAYAAVNSKDAKLVTTVYTINVGDKKERASFEYQGTNTLDLTYCGNSLYFVGDNCVYTITSQKRQRETFAQGKANTVCFGYTKEGELLYVYSDYSSASENHLVNVSPSGRIRKRIELKKRPKGVTSISNEISVLYGDSIEIYSLTSGESKGEYKCDDGVTSAYKLSSKVFVSKGQQIDVIEQ